MSSCSSSHSLGGGTPDVPVLCSSPPWGFLSRLSPTARRRASQPPKKIHLSAGSNSLSGVCPGVRLISPHSPGAGGNIGRRYSAHADRVNTCTSGQWQPPPGTTDIMSDMAPGLLFDLQCLARKLVIEHRRYTGSIVLGKGDEEDFSDIVSAAGERKATPDDARSHSATGTANHGAYKLVRSVSASGLRPLKALTVTSEDNADSELAGPDGDGGAEDAADRLIDPSERTWFNHVTAQYVGEMEKMLAEEDIHVDRRDYFTGFTALHWACKYGNKDMLKLCLDNNASTSIRTHSGCSALHLASKYGRADICTALLDAGADSNLRDSRGKLAYHVAHNKIPDQVKERLLRGVNHNASKALTLLNIQVKKSSSSSNNRINLSSSKSHIDPEEASLGPRGIKNSWFKRKSSGQPANTSSMPIFGS